MASQAPTTSSAHSNVATPVQVQPAAGASADIVVLPVPGDTIMTPFMLAQAERDAAMILPPGWFVLALVEDEDGGERQDHVYLERVAGPPIGCFEIRRERGRFAVMALPEPEDARGDVEPVGRHRSVTDAVRAILGHINGRLEAWTLPPLVLRAG